MAETYGWAGKAVDENDSLQGQGKDWKRDILSFSFSGTSNICEMKTELSAIYNVQITPVLAGTGDTGNKVGTVLLEQVALVANFLDNAGTTGTVATATGAITPCIGTSGTGQYYVAFQRVSLESDATGRSDIRYYCTLEGR